MATAPLRSGFAEINSSRRVPGNPLSYRVGPWPALPLYGCELIGWPLSGIEGGLQSL